MGCIELSGNPQTLGRATILELHTHAMACKIPLLHTCFHTHNCKYLLSSFFIEKEGVTNGRRTIKNHGGNYLMVHLKTLFFVYLALG